MIIVLIVVGCAVFGALTVDILLRDGRGHRKEITDLEGQLADLNRWRTTTLDLARMPPASDRGWLHNLERRRLIVHSADGSSIEGLLDTEAPDGVVLRSSRLLGPGGTEMAGEIWIPRAQILFVQTVPVAAT